MRRVVTALLLGLCFSGTETRAGFSEWIFPGEYESHQAIWMLWPTYENKAGFPSTEPMADMIRAMSGHVQVNLAVQDAAEEADVRSYLSARGVPLGHVHFFQFEHLDIWARDMGPQFTRSRSGKLRINDWNFSYWGNEEPDSFNSTFEEGIDRTIASLIDVPTLDARPGPATGVRMIHEGGGVTHNGHGTMIAVESVVIQRNLGPGRFCGGQAPVTDYDEPNTYAPNPDWPACRSLVEEEYRRMLGAKKVIWVPTGIVEDNGTFRGRPGEARPRAPLRRRRHSARRRLHALHHERPHRRVPALRVARHGSARPGEPVARSGGDAGPGVAPLAPGPEPRAASAGLRHHFQGDDGVRRAHPSHRNPSARAHSRGVPAGDGTYDYYAGYDRWEDGSTLPEAMLAVWPASYVNYVPTNDLVLVPKFWRPGRPLESWLKDTRGARHPEIRVPRARGRPGPFGERQPGRGCDELHHPATAGEREVRPEVRVVQGQGRRRSRDALRACDGSGGTGQRASAPPMGWRRLPWRGSPHSEIGSASASSGGFIAMETWDG